MVNHGHDQVLVKALPLRRLVQNIGDLAERQTIIDHGCGQQGPCGRGADRACEVLFGKAPPHAVGAAVFVQADIILHAELLECAGGCTLAGNALGQRDQVADF